MEDLPDGDDGDADHRGEGDAPAEHVRPRREDVVIVRAAFVVDPAEHQDQLKEKMMSWESFLSLLHSPQR